MGPPLECFAAPLCASYWQREYLGIYCYRIASEIGCKMSPESLTASRQSRSTGILGVLVAAYVALLPYQFQLERGINLAPADIFLVLALVLAAGRLKYRKQAWTVWHFWIALTFAVGSLISAARMGTLESVRVSE